MALLAVWLSDNSLLLVNDSTLGLGLPLGEMVNTHTHTHHFNGHFPGKPGLSGCP